MNTMSENTRIDWARSLIENAPHFDPRSYYADDIQYGEYADTRPYYFGDLKLVAMANWNAEGDCRLMPRLAAALEWLGVTIDWYDEYCPCSDCYRYVRISPDCYGWTMQGVYLDYGGMLCADCAENDPDAVIEEYIGDADRALTLDNGSVMLDDAGWQRLNDDTSYKHGLHGGQDDNPQVVAQSLRRQGVDDFVFVVDGCGQFDMDFSVWVRPEDYKRLQGVPIDSRQAEDPATLCERGLREASVKMRELPDTGIKYAEINMDDGTADVRII